MVESRTEGLIDAPLEVVWELAIDPQRQAEWWPDSIEFEPIDQEFAEGCRIRNVQKRPWPMKELHSTLKVEAFDPGHELLVRCQDTGSFTRIVCTGAQGGTFLEVAAGNEPKETFMRVFDAVAGKRFFRRWVTHALDALKRTAEREGTPPELATKAR